jgi:hypothetical protein
MNSNDNYSYNVVNRDIENECNDNIRCKITVSSKFKPNYEINLVKSNSTKQSNNLYDKPIELRLRDNIEVNKIYRHINSVQDTTKDIIQLQSNRNLKKIDRYYTWLSAIILIHLFTLYYVMCFCAVYLYSGIGWLYGCIISIVIETLIIELIFQIVLAMIREIVCRNRHVKFLKRIYKYIAKLINFIS